MNLANSISVIRLALIPILIALLLTYQRGEEWIRLLAFAVFFTAAISDGIDGFIARRFDQRTRLGAVLDPLADKLLINITLIFLAVIPHFDTQVPMWLPPVILGRDITIASGAYFLNRFMGPLRPRPRILGKVATVAHSVGIGWVLVNWPYGDQVLLIMVAISLTSLADYLLHGYEHVAPEKSQATGDAE